MEFNTNKFNSSKFKDRTFAVPVPELSSFFTMGENEKPCWVVKALGSSEIAVANEAIKANQGLSELVAALASSNSKEKIEAIQETMGLQKSSVPEDIVRRISLLVSGSVNPVCDQETAVRISNTYSTVFYRLTNKILSLTGEGLLPGE